MNVMSYEIVRNSGSVDYIIIRNKLGGIYQIYYCDWANKSKFFVLTKTGTGLNSEYKII